MDDAIFHILSGVCVSSVTSCVGGGLFICFTYLHVPYSTVTLITYSVVEIVAISRRASPSSCWHVLLFVGDRYITLHYMLHSTRSGYTSGMLVLFLVSLYYRLHSVHLTTTSVHYCVLHWTADGLAPLRLLGQDRLPAMVHPTSSTTTFTLVPTALHAYSCGVYMSGVTNCVGGWLFICFTCLHVVKLACALQCRYLLLLR
jgi:hypothetical protein